MALSTSLLVVGGLLVRCEILQECSLCLKVPALHAVLAEVWNPFHYLVCVFSPMFERGAPRTLVVMSLVVLVSGLWITVFAPTQRGLVVLPTAVLVMVQLLCRVLCRSTCLRELLLLRLLVQWARRTAPVPSVGLAWARRLFALVCLKQVGNGSRKLLHGNLWRMPVNAPRQ